MAVTLNEADAAASALNAPFTLATRTLLYFSRFAILIDAGIAFSRIFIAERAKVKSICEAFNF